VLYNALIGCKKVR